MTARYNGKVAATKITRKISIDRNGEAMTRDWEAKREPAVAK